MNFAVNVLGTYTMTELMVPLLEKASPDARVITVSSGGMYTTPLTKDFQVTVMNISSETQSFIGFEYDLFSFSCTSILRATLMGLNSMLETSVLRSVKLMIL